MADQHEGLSNGKSVNEETLPSPKDTNNVLENIDEPNLPKWQLLCLGISLSFGLFLSLLDTTIVATALYTIGVDFNTLNAVNWVALAYTLSYLGCVVLFARMADIIGRRDAYISAFVIFFAFSLGCGFAQSLNQLIICRVFQGIGGSGLYSLTMVIIPEICTLSMRKWIGAAIGAIVAMSGILGPLLGGIITHYTTWRWIFWINAPVGIIPLILFFVAWPKADHMRHAERLPLRDLDFVGSVLLIAASVLVVFSFQNAGIRSDVWSSTIFIVPLVIGTFGWIMLFGWEVLADRYWHRLLTMFPLRLIRNRVYSTAVISTMLTGYSYFVVIYSLPLRLQVVHGRSPLAAGVALLPMLGSTAIGSVIGGRVSGRKNRTFPTLLAGSCFMALGTGLLSTLGNTASVQAKMYGFLVFAGLGFGLTLSTSSMLSTMECELRDHAVAQGIVAQCRILGGSIGIAASTATLGVMQRKRLSGIVGESQLASLSHSSHSTLSDDQLNAVHQVYSDAFSRDMIVCTIISSVCILVTLGTFQKHPLSVEEKRSQQVARERDRIRKRNEVAVDSVESKESGGP
ncbi:major facilitator superfamily transporter [Phlyctema vagabunda]|uniref:Major facilitator superfamily transporter n=1 Tax=Phlyctema vagabunda TaxID=108571 RepID=A0ABR4PZK7_9HELO